VEGEKKSGNTYILPNQNTFEITFFFFFFPNFINYFEWALPLDIIVVSFGLLCKSAKQDTTKI